jgi:hypothetical protein
MCRIVDQFCSFFDKDDVGIMNYIDDLSSYWVKGYGYPINYEISCVLMQNFVVPGYRRHCRFAEAEANSLLIHSSPSY